MLAFVHLGALTACIWRANRGAAADNRGIDSVAGDARKREEESGMKERKYILVLDFKK